MTGCDAQEHQGGKEKAILNRMWEKCDLLRVPSASESNNDRSQEATSILAIYEHPLWVEVAVAIILELTARQDSPVKSRSLDRFIRNTQLKRCVPGTD